MAVLTDETKPKISTAETERSRRALRYAVSHNRIEGQFMSPQGTSFFEAYVRGEIDEPEIEPSWRVSCVRVKIGGYPAVLFLLRLPVQALRTPRSPIPALRSATVEGSGVLELATAPITLFPDKLAI